MADFALGPVCPTGIALSIDGFALPATQPIAVVQRDDVVRVSPVELRRASDPNPKPIPVAGGKKRSAEMEHPARPGSSNTAAAKQRKRNPTPAAAPKRATAATVAANAARSCRHQHSNRMTLSRAQAPRRHQGTTSTPRHIVHTKAPRPHQGTSSTPRHIVHSKPIA